MTVFDVKKNTVSKKKNVKKIWGRKVYHRLLQVFPGGFQYKPDINCQIYYEKTALLCEPRLLIAGVRK